jgi:hypothetical protein
MYSSFTENQLHTVFSYDVEQLKEILSGIIAQNVQPVVWDWLQEKASTATNITTFNTAFVMLPRKTGKSVINLTEEQDTEVQSIRKGLSINRWTIDRLCRVWLMLHLDVLDQERYFRTIENLFLTAEMNELVALYSSLPVLAYPEQWKGRCSEGIRSNIGDVLLAVICNNPYPAEYLSAPAWNQLIMKAFFTDKPIHQVIGLDERANQELANILTDYAHERWAAHRPVPPQLWRCVGKFINEHNFADIERTANSNHEIEREAALLACYDSNYPPAKELLIKNAEFKEAIERGVLSWETLAEKQMNNN